MNFSRHFTFALTIAGALVLASCGPATKDKSNSDDLTTAEGQTKEPIDTLVLNIPPPCEIPYLLESTGAEYNQSLINDRRKVDSYASRSNKTALNLGIYSTDIGYLISYDKTQQAIDYLNTSKGLGDNLGIIGAFDAEMIKKFESNISNKDSLCKLVEKSIQKTGKYLRDDSRNKLVALIMTGSFVEALYISTGLIKSYPKDLLPDDKRMLVLTPLIRVILNQEKSVDEMLPVLKMLEQTEPVSGIVNDLTTLQANYKSMHIQEKIKNNKANEVLTDKNLNEITSIVEKLRKTITE